MEKSNMTSSNTHDTNGNGIEPSMFVQRPSSDSCQDISHILTRIFRDEYAKDTIDQDTVRNLTTSRSKKSDYHSQYVEKLQQVTINKSLQAKKNHIGCWYDSFFHWWTPFILISELLISKDVISKLEVVGNMSLTGNTSWKPLHPRVSASGKLTQWYLYFSPHIFYVNYAVFSHSIDFIHCLYLLVSSHSGMFALLIIFISQRLWKA